MTLLEILALLTFILTLLSLIVDVIRLTIEVVAKFSQKKDDDNKKRLTALLPNCAVNLFDKRDGKLTLAVSAPSVFIIPHQRYLSRRFPMGGGHVSRPDFGMPQPDPAYPLTEFYLLLQHALDKAGRFALPALYARVQAPARHIYLDEAREYLSLSPTGREGDVRLLAEGSLQLLYNTLHVQPDGTPAALLLTEECTRATVAVQLLPPFVWEDPLPPLPDTPAALTLQLTMRDVMQADTDPAALGRKLAGTAANKRWLHHPKAETFLAERVALLQRVYKR